MYCLGMRGQAISDYNKWLSQLSMIQLNGGHCSITKSILSIEFFFSDDWPHAEVLFLYPFLRDLNMNRTHGPNVPPHYNQVTLLDV
jgi:hypothetical protein